MISTFIDSEQYRELPFENVDATDIHRILVPFVDQRLENLRFESVSTLKWVRSTDAPVRQILTWNKDLYGILRPSWGLSIDWVPHVGNTKITFCRTTKSARVAIGVTGQTSDA